VRVDPEAELYAFSPLPEGCTGACRTSPSSLRPPAARRPRYEGRPRCCRRPGGDEKGMEPDRRPALCSQAWWPAGRGPVWRKRRRVRRPGCGCMRRGENHWVVAFWFRAWLSPRGPVKRSRGSGVLPAVS